jgi:hypothetical protein
MPDLFVKPRHDETLRDIAHRLAKLLNLSTLECRDSSNYIGGEYFSSTALAIGVTFALSDESDLDEYKFWMVLKPEGVWVDDQGFLEGLADLLARRLTIAGESVVRILNVWSAEHAKRIFYSRKEGAAHLSDDEVVTTEHQATPT